MILTPPTNYGRHCVPAVEVGLYQEIPFVTYLVSRLLRLCMHLTSRSREREAIIPLNLFTVIILLKSLFTNRHNYQLSTG